MCAAATSLCDGAGEVGELWGGRVLESGLPPPEQHQPEAKDDGVGAGADEDGAAATLSVIAGLNKVEASRC